MKKTGSIRNSQIKTAVTVWQQLERQEGPADRYLKGFFLKNRKVYGARDRRFISDVIFSALRHKTYLEYWRDFLLENGSLQAERGVEGLMVLAGVLTGVVSESDLAAEVGGPAHFYLLLLERKLPQRDTARLINEVPLHIRFSYPEWLTKRWLSAFGYELLEEILTGLEERPHTVLRVNTLRSSRAKLQQSFEQQGITAEPCYRVPTGLMLEDRINLHGLNEFKRGCFEVQDQGSQLLCETIAPGPVAVWDVCAGGGGKTLALAALMKNEGRILATDIRESSLEALTKRAKRAGIKNVSVQLVESDLSVDGGKDVFEGDFEIVLVDAPCSGTGTLRRNPGAKWNLKPGDFEAFGVRQLKILVQAAARVKSGGLLYYATCSIDVEENERVVDNFLSAAPQFKVKFIGEGDTPYLKLWPHEFESDGFFMAALLKT